jgi:uncharacterized protein YdhG (YjbR/CyaY superfamily)
MRAGLRALVSGQDIGIFWPAAGILRASGIMRGVAVQPAIETIDQFIAGFPPAVQRLLRKVRTTIRAAAPDATEAMAYRIPTFKLNGNLVHFAAFQHHIGFYPASSGIAAFEDELARYVHARGSVQFPLGAPIPFDLITRITEFRVQENLAKKAPKARRAAARPAARKATKAR